MQHDHVIEALTPNRTNHPLHVCSLPRRARCGQHFVDAHVSHLFSEVIAEHSIAVAEEGARQLVEGTASRSCCPSTRRSGGRHMK